MPTPIGETLRNARVEKRLSLADAARVTRIRSQQLMALEQEQWRGTSPIYAKGFLRAYARYLGLDPEPLLEAYRQRVATPSDSTDGEAHAPVTRPPVKTSAAMRADQWSPQPVTSRSSKSAGWRMGTGPASDRRGVGVAALLAVVLLGGLALLGLRGAGQVGLGASASEAVAAPAPAPVPAPPAVVPPPRPAAPRAAGEPVNVTVRLSGSTYLRIEADGRELLAGRRPAGWRRLFSGNELVRLRGGDASRVSVVVNGRERNRLGDAGEPLSVEFRAPS